MFDIDRWAEIWASIRSNKLRTFLSGATIALALFVFITLFGLSKGLQNGFEEQFLPPNMMTIEVYTNYTTLPYKGKQPNRYIQLKKSDYQFLQELLKDRIEIVLPHISQMVTARNFSEFGNYNLIGTTSKEKKASDLKIISGRFLDPLDNQSIEKNVVIGRLVEKDLFKNKSAVGENIQLGNTLYKVVGVYSSEEGDDKERYIYLPINTYHVIYGTQNIDNFTLYPLPNSSLDELHDIAQEVEKELKIKHSVSPDDTRGVRAYDPKDALDSTNMFFYVFTIIVLVIGIGSLISGVVSIANMMVFSVKERTKEIGIRKALGATPFNIISLILQEALAITFLFGFIGIFMGMLLTYSVKDSLQDYMIYNATVESSRIVLAAIILLISGLLAGFIPARKAAKIKPIEALNSN
ncbi:ABC transporter permease [Ornithobacterium rhinotracheale]|uniref:ABC transporter permease n=1 Tax=Ornithobacterium rhinotracheale TaxID=28251 RepID=UPI00129CF177|nr:ABC transporter permease [Ornithobacterium rhinotracheale]MRJ08555.1 ABC transporter permease [Ornithobacterium rhinotracheale]UOH76827.1 ABC transporter permease [Ornithobacterium rhinotracheale]